MTKQFIEFKDIKSVERIRVASCIALVLTFCLFGLDFFRYRSGGFEAHLHYYTLFYLNLLGLLFIIPALHITKNKKWIIQKRSRRAVVIWGIVLSLGNIHACPFCQTTNGNADCDDIDHAIQKLQRNGCPKFDEKEAVS